MTTPPDLLDAARTDPTTRLVLADCIRDDSGGIDTPAVLAVLDDHDEIGWACERCDCPEIDAWVGWDERGDWHYIPPEEAASPLIWLDGDGRVVCILTRVLAPKLTLYRFGRWHLVCPHCKRSVVARRAAATRRANELATVDTAPNLFSGVED
jgi:hypothetical protein